MRACRCLVYRESVAIPVYLTAAASAISLALSGCSVIITTGIFSEASTAHGVTILAAVTAHGTTLDTVTARVSNTGGRAVFIPRCGHDPLLLTQQFVNGAWINGESAACDAADALMPITLDPGITLVTVKVFTTSGRFRFVTTVGESEDFSSSARTTSNAFALP
jgi:hypothetical protein